MSVYQMIINVNSTMLLGVQMVVEAIHLARVSLVQVPGVGISSLILIQKSFLEQFSVIKHGEVVEDLVIRSSILDSLQNTK